MTERGGSTLVEGMQRRFRIETHPIGIDTRNIELGAARSESSREVQRLRSSLNGQQLIIGVDRLDYTKGLPQRFRAFHRYLREHPASRGRVSLLQVAPPTRQNAAGYSEIRRTMERLAGQVNGEFADIDWTPIRYMNRSFNRRTLFGFLRLARVGLITPLRDGMNLVAMEYLASQLPDDPGVLILSRFAGAAERLPGAMIVNPYDVEDVASTIHAALNLPVAERRDQWQESMQVLRCSNVETWFRTFIDRLAEIRTEPWIAAGSHGA